MTGITRGEEIFVSTEVARTADFDLYSGWFCVVFRIRLWIFIDNHNITC